ncbi:hypothetical protein Trydic_g13447 [Trypoxylus dichotomus]
MGALGETVLNSYHKDMHMNVRTLAQTGKVHNTIKEMERLKIGILGISEMRWAGSNFFNINNYRVHDSRKVGEKYEHGVGVTVKNCIVQVYAATSHHSEEEAKEFNSQIRKILKELPKQGLHVVMGGKERVGDTTGPYGLGERNERDYALS